MVLSREEIKRYSRHLVLPEVGLEGQTRLQESRVLVVGAGGLGSPLAMYLAAAGVGHLGLIDFDVVDISNLQRQVLYTDADIGRPKLDAAAERIRGINPHVELTLHEERLDRDNALRIFEPYEYIADGTDNFATRYLVNDTCVLMGKTNVYGSILRFEGQVSVFDARRGPCYRCLFPDPPPPGTVPSCAEGGVLGVLPGVIGSLQAMEAIKLILGQGEPLIGHLLLFEGLTMNVRKLKLRKDPNCPVCGEHPSITELLDYEALCGMPDAPQDPALTNQEGSKAMDQGPAEGELRVQQLQARIEAGRSPVLLDVREPEEWAICHLEGAEHIPLGQLPMRLGELDPQRELVVYCHHGIRSAYAVAMMQQAGFENPRNLLGGIDAWAQLVDTEMPVY